MKFNYQILKKSFTYFLRVILSVALIFYFISSCSDDDDPVTPDPSPELNTYLKSLPELDQPDVKPYELTQIDTIETDNYVCHTEIYTGNPGFNEMLFSRTNSDVLYPGALLNGESVNDGSYTLCNLARGPMTLTVNLQSLSGNIFKTIENPSYSSIQSSIHEILSQEINGDAGAEMNWSIQKISNEAHLKVELGVNCDLANVFKVGQDFKFHSGIKYQRVIAKYAQKYYDVIIDQPTNPCDFLDLTNTSVTEVKNKMGNSSPMYISSVSYGRYALFYFESLDLEFDLKSEIEASVPLLIDGVGAINVGAKNKLETLMSSGTVNCKAYILGGSGADASQSILTPDGFISFIQNGGRYSKDSPGKPISFTLRYLCNNTPVKVIKTTQYEEATCSKLGNKFRITLKDLKIKKIKDLASVEIGLFGEINLTHGGPGSPSGGGNFFKSVYHFINNPFGKIVNINVPYIVNTPLDVEFGTLSIEERQDAYIEFDMSSLRSSLAGIGREPFYPQTEKIYLNKLAEGDSFTIKTNTYWHELTLTYSVEILE